jgi:hypothetical protein
MVQTNRTDDRLSARFDSHNASGEFDLTAAELGVLMTGLSRSLNKIYLAGTAAADRQFRAGRDAMGYEPYAIGLKIISVRPGSVVLDAAVAVLPHQDAIREAGKELVLGVLTHAIYERYGRKILLYDFGRAVKRVSKGALGKSFELVIKLRGKSLNLTAHVSQDGDVDLGSTNFPEDDVQ